MRILITLLLFVMFTGGVNAISYNLGTKAQFDIEHLKMQIADGWAQKQIKEGKIGVDWRGWECPDACRTTAIVAFIRNPNKEDDYMWEKRTDNNLRWTTELQYNLNIAEWYPPPEALISL